MMIWVVTKDVVSLLSFMEDRSDMGGVSGLIYNGNSDYSSATNIFFFGGGVIKTNGLPFYSKLKTCSSGLIQTDLIPNAGFFRKEVLSEFPWDEKYKIGKEHLDFFLRQKYNKKWRYATYKKRCFVHAPETENMNYMASHRKAKGKLLASKEHFEQKWGFKYLVKGSTIKGSKTKVSGLRKMARVAKKKMC